MVELGAISVLTLALENLTVKGIKWELQYDVSIDQLKHAENIGETKRKLEKQNEKSLCYESTHNIMIFLKDVLQKLFATISNNIMSKNANLSLL